MARIRDFSRYLLLIVAIAIAVPTGAFACSYIAFPNPPLEYISSRTRSIFLGTVIQRTMSSRTEDGETYDVHRVLFRIDQNLKGENRETFEYQYWEQKTNRTSCYRVPPHPQVGEQWVIFSVYDEGDGSARNIEDPLRLNWRYDAGDKRSRELFQSTKAAAGFRSSALFSEVEVARSDKPLGKEHNLKVQLLNSDRRLVEADVEEGQIAFQDIEPGKYVFRLRSPKPIMFATPSKLVMERDEGGSYIADIEVNILPNRPEFVHIVLQPSDQ